MASPTSIRFDLVEEHLEEAAFLSVQRERALVDPEYTLAEVRDGPEERMLAHLDGLVVSGRRAAELLLVPALAADEPEVTFAAASALLASEDGDFIEPVTKLLAEGEAPHQDAAVRALQLTPRSDLLAHLAPVLAKGPPLAQAHVLRVLAFRRVDPGVRLDAAARSKDPALRQAVLLAGRVFPERIPPQLVEHALGAEDPAERAAAMETGLVLGSRAARAACEARVRGGGDGFGRAAVAWALLGEADLAPLLAALDDEARREEALFALGFTGRVPAVIAALRFVAHEELGKLAAEAVSAITGLAVSGDLAAPPRRWDPDAPEEPEADEEAGPEADLPAPQPELVLAWWEAERERFDPARRWFGGRPWSVEALVAALEDGPCRRREALALDLAIRSRGQHQLETSALAPRQLADLAEIRRAMPRNTAT